MALMPKKLKKENKPMTFPTDITGCHKNDTERIHQSNTCLKTKQMFKMILTITQNTKFFC
jgi:hypothetical protein